MTLRFLTEKAIYLKSSSGSCRNTVSICNFRWVANDHLTITLLFAGVSFLAVSVLPLCLMGTASKKDLSELQPQTFVALMMHHRMWRIRRRI